MTRSLSTSLTLVVVVVSLFHIGSEFDRARRSADCSNG